jgi:hypothetical protein
VEYRSSHPDEQTVKDVMKELQDNNIDVTQFLEFSTDHCQQAKSSAAGGSSAKRLV